jgi:hypothetical protein
MRDPLVQYLVGAGILSVGLMILLSSAEIAHSLGRFWDRWTGKLPRGTIASRSDRPPLYRLRLIIWRAIGILVAVDGVIWLALATSELLHLLPRARH